MGSDQDVAKTVTTSNGPEIKDVEDLKQHAVTTTSRQDSTSDGTSTQVTSDRSAFQKCRASITKALLWAPPRCRWDVDNPPKFSMSLNFLFAFAGAATVANLYYSHPILNILAHDFGVPYVKVAQIPTLAQAGYAVGLLLLCPLGDMVRRRPFVLGLVFFTAAMSIGLATTNSIAVFSAIQFITAVTTVTPQLMMPLVGDLAPPHRRAASLSIVTSGLMLGILIARLLSGVLTQYTSWRNIYWFSVASQFAIFFLLYAFMPDYPSTNTSQQNYFKFLFSILTMLTRHPVLVQACLISLFISSTFTNYWTVLTFLLAGPPYHYDSLVIGLFALIGIASMCFGPFYARYVTDRFVPAFTVICGILYVWLGVALGTYTGTFTVAGPVLQAFLGDFGMQISQIANRSAIYAVEPKGRNRVNTAFMLFTFCGQLIGTSVGAQLYARGGWIASGSYSMGAMGMAFLICLARGPWEEGWVGWHGGWSIRKKDRLSSDGKGGEIGAAELEKGPRDEHVHRHGRDNQVEVNAMDAEKILELAAAEDKSDEKDDDSQDEIQIHRT